MRCGVATISCSRTLMSCCLRASTLPSSSTGTAKRRASRSRRASSNKSLRIALFSCRRPICESFLEFFAATNQARLGSAQREVQHGCDFAQSVAVHVMQDENLSLRGLHERKLSAHMVKFHLGFRSGVSLGMGPGLRRRIGIMNDSSLPLPGAKSVQCYVSCDAACPRPQATVARKCFLRERAQDLFETGLDEIIVIVLTSAEHTVQGVVDHSNQSIVNLASNTGVTFDHSFNDFRIGNFCPALTEVACSLRGSNRAEPGTLCGGASHGREWVRGPEVKRMGQVTRSHRNGLNQAELIFFVHVR